MGAKMELVLDKDGTHAYWVTVKQSKEDFVSENENNELPEICDKKRNETFTYNEKVEFNQSTQQYFRDGYYLGEMNGKSYVKHIDSNGNSVILEALAIRKIVTNISKEDAIIKIEEILQKKASKVTINKIKDVILNIK